MRAVVEAGARSVVATQAVPVAWGVLSARAFKLTGDTNKSLSAHTGRSGARTVSVSVAWVGGTARALTGAVHFGESEVALALAGVSITKALSGTHFGGSSIYSCAFEFARLSGVTATAAAFS